MIVIYASELAACIGMNKYRPVSQVARKVWCRSDPEGYMKALLRNDTSEPEPIKDTLEKLKLTEKVNSIVNQIQIVTPEIQTLAQSHETDLSSQGVSVSDLTSHVLTERGKNSEESSLNRLEKTINMKINERNDKFYKRTLSYAESSDDRKYVLGGKVDGITEDGHLVEIKNRQYRIFPELPIYEKVQIHAYMFLTGIVKCKYVQSFKGKDVQEIVEFDEKFWNMMKGKCRAFVKCLEKVMHDESLQDQLISLGVFPCVAMTEDGSDEV